MNVSKIKHLVAAPESTVDYYITSNVDVIEADESGVPLAPTQAITFTQWKRVGQDAAVQSSDHKLRAWKVLNGVNTRLFSIFQGISGEFTAADVSGYQHVLIELMDGSTVLKTHTIDIKWRGSEGYGYKAVVYRNAFTETQWNTYGTVGHEGSWDYTSGTRNGCRAGDLFVVVGYATDTGNYHIATYRCNNDTGNLRGVCISHQITRNGDDAVTHEIRCTPYVVTRSGNTLTPSSVVIEAYKTVGDSAPVLFTGYVSIQSNTGYVIHTGTHTVYGLNVNTSMDFPLTVRVWASSGDADSSDPLAMTTIHMVSDGEKGDTGPTFYPAGVYSSTKTYTMTDKVCPVVLYSDGNYYYLKQPTNRVNGNAYGPGTDYWALADKMVLAITEALFAQFAKLGSFVVSGDFFISQYGTLYQGQTANTIGNSNYEATWGGQVPYCYFDGSDPMVATMPASGSYKFRPTLVLNARTGDTYQNNAYVRGEVHATSGTFEDVAISGKSTFGGLLKKSKTLITSDNISEYGEYDDNYGGYVLDLEKTGTWIGIGDTGGVMIILPGLYASSHDNAHTAFSAANEKIRSLVGNTLIIYSLEQQGAVQVTGNSSVSVTGSATSFSIRPGECAVLECRMRFLTYGGSLQEDIYWLRSVGYVTH